MAPSRKSRRMSRTKRSSRRSSSRRSSRRSKVQRGGAITAINCSLDAANKVQVASPPQGITIDNSVPKSLTITSTGKVTDIAFAGPNGPINPRVLGVGAGIIIEQGTTALVPRGFTAIRSMTAAQRRLNSTTPAEGAIRIRNLETGPLNLSATNRNFTITVTTV